MFSFKNIRAIRLFEVFGIILSPVLLLSFLDSLEGI
jgi:hypothetical protein